MRFKRRHKISIGLTSFQVTALINVMLLVAFFFVLEEPLTGSLAIGVKLPKSITSDILKEDSFIITLTAENVLYVNGKLATPNELSAHLPKMSFEGKMLFIKADRRASIGRLIEIWNICRQAGITNINIATNEFR